MIGRVLNHLYGYERLRHRGDRLFLAGEFERARHEYVRARSVLTVTDHRTATIDALIHQCDTGARERGVAVDTSVDTPDYRDDDHPFHPGLLDLFELAIAEKDPERIDVYRASSDAFKAGYVALVQGGAERAVRLFGSAAAATAPSFVVHLELGRAHSLAGDMEAAREALKVAARIAPNDAEVAVLLSAVDIELGRYDEAHKRLSALTSVDRDNPDVTFLTGRALAGLRRDDDALETFRETVAMEPNFHEAYYEAALVLANKDEDEARYQLLSRASALAPDEVRYNRALATLVLQDSSLDEEAGLAACDRSMIMDEDNAWEYLYWIAQLYIRRGWKREARDPLEKALRMVPPNKSVERRAIESCLSTLR